MKSPGQPSPRDILIAVFILSLSSFMLVGLFHSALYLTMDIAQYLVFHNIAEFFSVMVSLSIFGVGWYTYEQSKNRHALFLSFAFLGIGLMDFMHALGYAGMPDLITANSANKSTQFWIAVRLFSATAFLLSAYVYPDTAKRWLTKWSLGAVAFASSTLVFIGVIYYPSLLPATFIEGTGLTTFKIYSEYLIVALLALAFIAYWKRLSRTGDKLLIYYLAAFILCIFSELAFTLYKSAFDSYNVLGHVYKIIAFLLIYKGIFIASVNRPYVEVGSMGEALRESEKFFSGTLNDMLTFVAVLEPDGKVIFVNNTPLDVAGITLNDVKGKMFYDAFWWQYSEEARQQIKEDIEICATGETLVHEIELQTVEGGLIWIEYSMHPIYDEDGKIKYLVPEGRDITDRKRAEKALHKAHDELEVTVAERTKELAQANIQLKELDRLKSMFIASMSHELRTPLNSIIGFTGIILQGMAGEITEEQRKQLIMVKNSANHLLDLINDIIDLSKIEADKAELAIEEFDLSGLVQEVKDSFRVAAAEKGLKLSLKTPKKLVIKSDERRTKQVLVNLVSNAVKFTDRGEIEIKVTKKDGTAEISVADTGIGIKKEHMDMLFKAFSQVPLEGRPTQEGTGLGLYLSKKITGLIGGNIWAESKHGKGSEFTFALPLKYQEVKT